MSASARENGAAQLSVNGNSSNQPSIGTNRRISPASAEVSILKDAATGEEMFVKGVGTHMWQSSGDETSNWTRILRSWHPLNFPRFAMARLTGGLTVLESCPNSWDRYEEDSTLAEGLGCNGFRTSLEWSRIEPRQGYIDQAAVQRYRDIFASLKRHHMVPNVTLHHFTHPAWFDDLGGFTRPENIQLFVNYAVKAVELFGDQVQLWATFNEPTSSSTMGFIFGAYPPGKMFNLKLAGIVLLNMLRAHTAAYRAIKAMPGGDRYKVGLTHMIIPFTSWPDLGPLTAHSRFAARWLTFWWGYDLIHGYFTKGEFSWCIPGLLEDNCVFQVKDEKPPLDWFGVNFYSRPVLSPFVTPGRKPWQVISDLGYPIDPEGMYKVLHRSAEFGVPLYVTETGVSINSQRHRQYMVDSYVKEILHAMADGVDVRGIYYWTLLDNFEWNGGYGIKFGLFEWSPWLWGKDRAKRTAADTLTNFYKAMPNTVAGVRQFSKKTDLSHPNSAPRPHSIRWWLTNIILLYFQALELGLEWLGKRLLPEVPIGKYWQKQEYYEQEDLSLGSLLNPKI